MKLSGFLVERTGVVSPQVKSSLTLTSNYRVPKSRHDYTRNTSLPSDTYSEKKIQEGPSSLVLIYVSSDGLIVSNNTGGGGRGVHTRGKHGA